MLYKYTAKWLIYLSSAKVFSNSVLSLSNPLGIEPIIKRFLSFTMTIVRVSPRLRRFVLNRKTCQKEPCKVTRHLFSAGKSAKMDILLGMFAIRCTMHCHRHRIILSILLPAVPFPQSLFKLELENITWWVMSQHIAQRWAPFVNVCAERWAFCGTWNISWN